MRKTKSYFKCINLERRASTKPWKVARCQHYIMARTYVRHKVHFTPTIGNSYIVFLSKSRHNNYSWIGPRTFCSQNGHYWNIFYFVILLFFLLSKCNILPRLCELRPTSHSPTDRFKCQSNQSAPTKLIYLQQFFNSNFLLHCAIIIFNSKWICLYFCALFSALLRLKQTWDR